MNIPMNMFMIAILNTVFRVVIVAIQAPFISVLERVVKFIIKDKTEIAEELRDVDRLEERFLDHPALAIEQTRETINTMARLTRRNILDARRLLAEYSDKGMEKVKEIEGIVDTYEDKLGSYLVKIMKREMSDEQNKTVNKYYHAITDFERISDHALNLGECAEELNQKKIEFTEDASKELKVLLLAVEEVLDLAVKAFVEDDMEAAYSIEPLEETIDNLCDEIKLRHVDRIAVGKCKYTNGFVFNDILNNCERIGDHCSNIGIAEKSTTHEMASHDTLSFMELEREHGFDRKLAQYAEKYSLN